MDSTGPGPAHRLLTALGETMVQDRPGDSLRGGPCPKGSLLRPHTSPVPGIWKVNTWPPDSQSYEALNRQGWALASGCHQSGWKAAQ